MPAQWARSVGGCPSPALASATAPVTRSGSARSATTGIASMRVASLLARCALRSTITTEAPSRARISAVARPMPDAPPVTSARAPAKRCSVTATAGWSVPATPTAGRSGPRPAGRSRRGRTARSRDRAADARRDLGAGRDPHVAVRGDEAHERVEEREPARPPDDLRVHREDADAAQAPDAEELLLPDLPDLAGGGDLLVPRVIREPEVRRVVAGPLHRQLDEL